MTARRLALRRRATDARHRPRSDDSPEAAPAGRAVDGALADHDRGDREIIQQINALDVSIILVEQNAMLALTLAQYGYVLETGSLVMQGDARELLRDEGVKKAYLGI